MKTAPKTGHRLLWKHKSGDIYLVKWLHLYNFFILKRVESNKIQGDTRMVRNNKRTRSFSGWQFAPEKYKKTYLAYENIDEMRSEKLRARIK